jgi:hypothetical protein
MTAGRGVAASRRLQSAVLVRQRKDLTFLEVSEDVVVASSASWFVRRERLA